MEHGLLRRYFAAFSKIPGFSNWVIAKASLELKKPEIKNICLRKEIGHSEMGNKYAEPGCSEMSNKCNQTETGHSEMDNGDCDRNRYDADKVKCRLSDCIYYNDEPEAEILRQKKNYALMSVSERFLDDSKIRLDIHLIKLISSNEKGFNLSVDKTNDGISDSDAKDKEHISDEYMGVESNGKICDMLFGNKEIIDFVESVDDKNPIHRNEKAVVPGFLIMEKFLEDKDLFGKETDKDIFDLKKRRKENKTTYDNKKMESAFKIEIKYILPVFAGERIYLYRDGNMITGMVQRSGCGSDENKGIKVFEIKCRGD
mgnify:FL=1